MLLGVLYMEEGKKCQAVESFYKGCMKEPPVSSDPRFMFF